MTMYCQGVVHVLDVTTYSLHEKADTYYYYYYYAHKGIVKLHLYSIVKKYSVPFVCHNTHNPCIVVGLLVGFRHIGSHYYSPFLVLAGEVI